MKRQMTMIGPNVSQKPRSQSCFVCQSNFSESFHAHINNNDRHLSKVKSETLYQQIDKELDCFNHFKRQKLYNDEQGKSKAK